MSRYTDRIDEWLDAEIFVNELLPNLTDMQGAICVLIMEGMTVTEIASHFELNRDTVYRHLAAIRRTARGIVFVNEMQFRLPLKQGDRAEVK